MILAIDPGATTGWAAWSVEHGIESGTWSLGSKAKAAGEGHANGARFSLFRQRLHSAVDRYSVEFVAIETPFVPQAFSPAQVRLAYGWLAVVAAYCFDNNLPPAIEIAPQQWRAHFLPGWRPNPKMPANDRRKAWKTAAKRQCANRDWPHKSADEAEALGMLDYARVQVDPGHAAARGRNHQLDFLESMMEAI